MSRLTVNELLTAVAGRWLGPAIRSDDRDAASLGRIVHDSREVEPGDVFWALPGRNHDGSDFIADAYAHGAAGVVTCARNVTPPHGRWAIGVDRPWLALQYAARWQRARFEGDVIAVTGSVGKTTTRQLIDAVLATQYAGTASPRNYNNHLGVPLSMFAWHADHDYAVLELGASCAGEIAALTELCKPRVGVITKIAEAHLGGFGSVHGVADAKAELLDALPSDGWAVLNGDDPHLRRVARRSRARITWFGRGADADVVATNVHQSNGHLSFTVDKHEYTVPVWGRHHLTGALAAVTVGRAWGISPPAIAAALAGFQLPPLRCEVSHVGGATVINDCYNANPSAMRAALQLLREMDVPGRRIALCGDMRELGPDTARLSRILGDDIVTLCGADVLLACGEQAQEVIAGARAAGMPASKTLACRNSEEAAIYLTRLLRPGDCLLVKGSRAMSLENCVERLRQAAWN